VWLIYALGGGWGHLTRAVALASIAGRERPVRILMNSPYASIVVGRTPWSARVPLDPPVADYCNSSRPTRASAADQGVRPTKELNKELNQAKDLDPVILDHRAPAEAVRRAVLREIAECRPSCLIVDTFPRGIGGELADVLTSLDARKVLVHRDLNPRYVNAAGLRSFVTSHYDLVVVPGPCEGSQFGDLPIAVETAPWLVRPADQIPDRSAVKNLLRLTPEEESCVLVCAAGKQDELDWYAAVVSAIREREPGAPVRLVAAERPAACPEECWVRYWPAMDLFQCAAVVVGSAGYNTVQECLAWRVPLVARPWPRIYDRQSIRAEQASARGRLTVVETPEDAARSALLQINNGPPGEPSYANGAAEAVRRICTLL
jgi:hypothetical protein